MSTHLNDKPVYIVSGFMRTGTSMMMLALEKGGMNAVKRSSREKMRKMYADKFYDPNEGGLYELEGDDYKQIGFPRKYKGKLIKCLMGGLDGLCVTPMKVCFMRREVEEIAQSYEAFFDHKFLIDKSQFQNKVDLQLERMRNRRDVELTVFWYKEVVAKPEKEFQRLKEDGWPIDVSKCVQVIKPELYRFRLERLTVGI